MADPRTIVARLADNAVDLSPGSAIVHRPGAPDQLLGAGDHQYGALVGLTGAADAVAVAACLDGAVWGGPRRRPARIGWAVHHDGTAAVRARLPDGEVVGLRAVSGPLHDVALRALGRPTAPCRRPTVEVLDAHFADAALARLAASSPITWPDLCGLHPLGDPAGIGALELRDLRRRFARQTRWADMRAAAVDRGGPGDDPSPSVAAWLDEGALARWILARYPDVEMALGDLAGAVEPHTAAALATALERPRLMAASAQGPARHQDHGAARSAAEPVENRAASRSRTSGSNVFQS